LLQAADLVTLLKVCCANSWRHSILLTWFQSRLNIQEIALPAASASALSATASAPAAEEPEAVCSYFLFRSHFDTSSQEKVQEKTVFNVKLESFDAAAKPKIIKEVKSLVPNLTLIEARQLSQRLS
jgi:large subunit ribosomal protein L7/L12